MSCRMIAAPQHDIATGRTTIEPYDRKRLSSIPTPGALLPTQDGNTIRHLLQSIRTKHQDPHSVSSSTGLLRS